VLITQKFIVRIKRARSQLDNNRRIAIEDIPVVIKTVWFACTLSEVKLLPLYRFMVVLKPKRDTLAISEPNEIS
jgi:hypothetical protein